MNIWNPADEIKHKWVHNFANIFIEGKREQIDTIFSSDFGLHNGYTLEGYCDYEFAEFALKCERFGLEKNAMVEVFDIGHGMFYFSLGKSTDKAVFEAIFSWDTTQQKARGNQYVFRIEPKMQFFKTNEQVLQSRRINIKPVNNETIHKILPSVSLEDLMLIEHHMPEHLGSRFYAAVYNKDNEDTDTYWDKVIVATNQGIFKQQVLMRGKDHPLFIDNLFPLINNTTNSIHINEHVFPVIVNVIFEDNTEQYFKYPEEKSWNFNKRIKSVCLTDTLSFDWVVNNYI